MRKDLVFCVALLAGGSAVAQDAPRPLVWRDFAAVQQLRVVCSNRHYGRLDDLLVEVPSGRLTAAVVGLPGATGPRRVVVPFADLQFDTATNLLQLAACPDEQHVYAPFDPAGLGVTAPVAGDGSVGEPAGVLSVATLARGPIALRDGAAAAHGATLELSRGHLAFLDVGQAARPGDAELHPVPWAALGWRQVAGGDAQGAWSLRLARAREELGATPSRIDVILSDPLYRAKVHVAFDVRLPDYEAAR